MNEIKQILWLEKRPITAESDLFSPEHDPNAPKAGDTIRLVDVDESVSHFVLITGYFRSWYEGTVIGTFPWGEKTLGHEEFEHKQSRDGKKVHFKVEHVWDDTTAHHNPHL
ncbi:hypothetical protein [Dongshaea marina]|uniref:hypothetical protein n=1 Tax=Dongshaea marina TaxID=2047966 RepID=UPI000D3EE154|nr:hypothetical protein [Dongshaea marina]